MVTARLILTALFCFAMDAVAPVTALAQGGGATTSLSGTVTDTSGAIIPGATVVVKSVATATQFDTVTNESGYFTVPALDPGTYTVTVTLMGFKTAVLNDVRVNAGHAGVGEGRPRGRRPGGDGRRHRRLRDHPDAVGRGDDDDRRQPDPQAADRQPQRARVRALLPGVNTPGGRQRATRRSTACRRARSTSRSTASARRTTT